MGGQASFPKKSLVGDFSGSERLLDDLLIDLLAEVNTLLHLLLVVALGSLGLNVLLNGVNLTFIDNEFLLDVVQAVVNVILEDHVAARVMFHRMVRRLLAQGISSSLHKCLDSLESILFLLVVLHELVRARELVSHLVLHLVDRLLVHFHFLVHATLQILDLLQVLRACLHLNLQRGGRRLSISHLALFEGQIGLHVFNLGTVWQLVLTLQILLHVLEQGHDRLLGVRQLFHFVCLV